jgi:hypothetical protein
MNANVLLNLMPGHGRTAMRSAMLGHDQPVLIMARTEFVCADQANA